MNISLGRDKSCLELRRSSSKVMATCQKKLRSLRNNGQMTVWICLELMILLVFALCIVMIVLLHFPSTDYSLTKSCLMDLESLGGSSVYRTPSEPSQWLQ